MGLCIMSTRSLSLAFNLVRTQIAASKEHKYVHIDLNSKLRDLAINELEILFTSPEIANSDTITLSGNGLHNLGSNGLARLFAAFKNTNAKVLDLSDNELYLLGTTGLASALSALQETSIDAIDLRFNWFDLMEGDGLGQALLPLKDTHITTVALSVVEIYRPSQLAQIINALKHGQIRGIRLSFVLNYHVNVADLMQMLKTLKDTDAIAMDMSENSLFCLSTEALAQILGALKGTKITWVNLSGNNLQTLNCACRAEIFKYLPLTVKTIVLASDQIISFPHFYFRHQKYPICQTKLAEYLIASIKNQLQAPGQQSIMFEAIKFPLTINAGLFAAFIHTLENQASGIAYFCCGLLLENRVYFIENYNINDECVEKKAQDAITFYTQQKVLQDPRLKSKVDYILWEMRVINRQSKISDVNPKYNYPSIEERLRRLALEPPEQYGGNSHQQFSEGKKSVAFFTPIPQTLQSPVNPKQKNNHNRKRKSDNRLTAPQAKRYYTQP